MLNGCWIIFYIIKQAKCPETSASHVGDKLMVLETVDSVPGKADANEIVRPS